MAGADPTYRNASGLTPEEECAVHCQTVFAALNQGGLVALPALYDDLGSQKKNLSLSSTLQLSSSSSIPPVAYTTPVSTWSSEMMRHYINNNHLTFLLPLVESISLAESSTASVQDASDFLNALKSVTQTPCLPSSLASEIVRKQVHLQVAHSWDGYFEHDPTRSNMIRLARVAQSEIYSLLTLPSYRPPSSI